MTYSKQFTLFASGGPNPWKVTILLHELGLGEAYEVIYLNQGKGETKEEGHVKYNPNGRVPTLIDHSNNDFVVWESGAILQYLVEKYDHEKKLSFSKLEERITAQQYLMFQMSGQGPYFGQAAYFALFSPEKISFAITRYVNEINRVLSVMENILTDKEYLVSNKYSYADIAFIPWWGIVDRLASTQTELADWREKYPNVARWDKSIRDRPATVEAWKRREDIMAAAATKATITTASV